MSDSPAKGYPLPLAWFRYFCAFMLYTYGISKLLHLQFDMQSQLARQPVDSLSGYQLTWFYFGYSQGYAVLLGVTRNSALVPKDYSFGRAHNASGHGEHPPDQHLHFGQRLWAISHFRSHLHLLNCHPVVPAFPSQIFALDHTRERADQVAPSSSMDCVQHCFRCSDNDDLRSAHSEARKAFATRTSNLRPQGATIVPAKSPRRQ